LIKKTYRLLSYFAVIIVVFQFSGLDLFIAQTSAWGQMIKERQNKGTLEAIVSTLSGETPCKRCLAIAKVKEERDQAPLKKAFSIDKLPLPSENRSELTEEITWIKSRPPVYISLSIAEVTLEIITPPPRGFV